MPPLQIWLRPLGICKIPNTNVLISPPKNVRHPTAPTCCLCWTTAFGKDSFSKMHACARCVVRCYTEYITGYEVWIVRSWQRNLLYSYSHYIYSFIHSFIQVVCLTTVPKPLPKRALHIVRSRASSFKWEYPLLSLKPSNSFVRLLPCLPVTSIPPFIFPSVTRCRRQFRRKMWPIRFAFRLRISCRIFLCSLTLSNTSSFLTWSVQLIFSILLQHHISKLSGCICICIYIYIYIYIYTHTHTQRNTVIISQIIMPSSWTAGLLKMGTIGCPETSVGNTTLLINARVIQSNTSLYC